MVFDKFRNLSYFAIVEDATTLKDSVTIALNKELCRTSFGKFAVTCVNVHKCQPYRQWS